MRLEVAEFLHRVPSAIRIPKGTPAQPCRGGNCDKMMYMVPPKEPGGSQRSVSIDAYWSAKHGNIVGIAPTKTEDGAGIDHHANCADAKQFTRKKRS